MSRITFIALVCVVAGCGSTQTPGTEEYESGVQEMRSGIGQAQDEIIVLQSDLGSDEGREEIRGALEAMHSGAEMVERGLEMMGSDWTASHGCHGHAPDLADPVTDDLTTLDEAHEGMVDDDETDDDEHLGHFEEGLHELEHHLDSMELEMECMRHHG